MMRICLNKMLRLFAVLIAFLIAKSAAQESANFNQTYEGTTKPNGELTIYKYSFPSSNVVRVWIHSENAVTETPVMGVFRERHSIISAQLPFVLQKHTYKSVARILCPFIGNDTTGNDTRSNETMDSLSVEISSGSSTPVDYMINATLIDDFRLQIGERINRSASPSEPSIVRYRFQNDTDSVLVTVDSDDDICMTVTIQSVDECPVFDMESNIFFSGIRQTMIRKAYIPVHHRILKDFYIVFIARPDDRDCIKEKKPSDQSQPRLKKFSVTVENLVNDTSYWLPLSVTVAAIVTVYVLAFFYMAAVAKIERNDWLNHGKAIVEEAARAGEDNNAATHLHEGEENVEDNQEASEIAAEGSNVEVRNEKVVAIESAENKEVAEKEIARTKVHITVGDLTLKPFKQREKKYYLYAWNLIAIAMFYGLPVVQLVLIWQNTVNMSGDMDICFFNFRCARSFFSIYAFNSVISNIGYIALGVLFIIMVKQREVLHRRTVGSVMQDEEAEFGLPMHNGLLYALGIAIIMEGILSGSYHICPSPSNYQFDTSFMYILGVLGMLKLYQLRHSDINPNAHVSYAIMAFFIFMAMCGVYFDSLIFYIIFAVCYLIIMTLINVEFYFNTQWTLDFGMFGRMREAYSGIFKECPKGIMPTYKGRFLFLAIADAINILFVISGIITLPKNFASFLLMPFVGNLTLYLAYYLFMKKLHHEHIRLRTIAFILLASASWGASLYFFMNNVSDWIETPANSRTLNRECVLFHFYDNHDIWHFLSAMSLFFSFNIFLSLDDDLKWVRRNKIAVF